MAESVLDSVWSRRLAAYSYLRPVLLGGRVLEIGCGAGVGARHLAALGAGTVVGADSDFSAVEEARQISRHANLSFLSGVNISALQAAGPFDAVIIPEAGPWLRPESAFQLAGLNKLLAPRGRLVCFAPSSESRTPAAGAVGYYELADALAPHFPRVRMFGLTPFFAFGLAEFEEAPQGLRVESSLVDESAEEPTHYIAVAGADDAGASSSLGYALVQLPEPPMPPPVPG